MVFPLTKNPCFCRVCNRDGGQCKMPPLAMYKREKFDHAKNVVHRFKFKVILFCLTSTHGRLEAVFIEISTLAYLKRKK